MDLGHTRHDEQSLLLTRAALDGLRAQPEALRDVLATLDHWDRVAPPESKPLRDRWRRILASSDWSILLDTSSEAQQLRQASPLGRALDPLQRLAIIRACKGRSSNT